MSSVRVPKKSVKLCAEHQETASEGRPKDQAGRGGNRHCYEYLFGCNYILAPGRGRPHTDIGVAAEHTSRRQNINSCFGWGLSTKGNATRVLPCTRYDTGPSMEGRFCIPYIQVHMTLSRNRTEVLHFASLPQPQRTNSHHSVAQSVGRCFHDQTDDQAQPSPRANGVIIRRGLTSSMGGGGAPPVFLASSSAVSRASFKLRKTA